MTAGRCTDCHVNTVPRGKARAEYYVVNDDLWASAVASAPARWLCIGCLESRIGRTLCRDDFMAGPMVNDLNVADAKWAWSYRTLRLIARLSADSSIPLSMQPTLFDMP